MESIKLDNQILNINKNYQESKENKNLNNISIEQKKENEYFNLNNGQEDNNNLYYIAKRSYSCRINETKNKNFVNKEDIKINLNNKFMYLKTPQLKPKKSQLNPTPINLGSISCVKKKSRYNLLNNSNNNIIKDIISEGENEDSNEFSSDSSSNFTGGEEIKDNQENSIIDNIDNNENENNLKENEFPCKKLKTENTKYEKDENNKIEEENDDFDENGLMSLKNIRKDMIQSKRKFSKNDNDIFNKIDNNLIAQYKKYKEDILMGNEEEQIERKLHKTTGFSQARNRNGLPILEFLKKNSSTGIKLKNN